MFDSVQIVQSFVYTVHHIIMITKDFKYTDLFGDVLWIKSLGSEFTSKDIDTIYDKGKNILASLEFIYDDMTMYDLKLDMEDKSDVYRILFYPFAKLKVLKNYE